MTRIGINATSLNDRPSGARHRFVGLYGALFRANPNHDYWIYEPRDCRVASWFGGLANVRGIATPLLSHSRWQRALAGLFFWPPRLAEDRLDLFEALHLPLVRAPECPTLLTIHDARPVLPEVPAARRLLYRHVLRSALRRADQVITVSNAMRAELLAIEPSARIVTIYNGLDPAPYRRVMTSTIHPFGQPRDYLLAVGHFEPRKNYARLIAAFAMQREAYPSLGLVIVGKDGGTFENAVSLVERSKLGAHVRLLHDVDDEGLVGLYCGAKMVVFPSTSEGFGIPLLEAMAAGCPLAVSGLPVFRELTQDRGRYFDPFDPASISSAVGGLLESPDSQRQLADYGARRVKDFGFDKLASQLEAVHDRLMTYSGRP